MINDSINKVHFKEYLKKRVDKQTKEVEYDTEKKKFMLNTES